MKAEHDLPIEAVNEGTRGRVSATALWRDQTTARDPIRSEDTVRPALLVLAGRAAIELHGSAVRASLARLKLR